MSIGLGWLWSDWLYVRDALVACRVLHLFCAHKTGMLWSSRQGYPLRYAPGTSSFHSSPGTGRKKSCHCEEWSNLCAPTRFVGIFETGGRATGEGSKKSRHCEPPPGCVAISDFQFKKHGSMKLTMIHLRWLILTKHQWEWVSGFLRTRLWCCHLRESPRDFLILTNCSFFI